MQEKDIYFKRNTLYDKALNKLEYSEFEEDSIELIQKWHINLFSKGAGNVRVAKLSYQILKVRELLRKPLADITADDVETFSAKVNTNNEWSEYTKKDYKRCLKQFYLWYKKKDPRRESNPKVANELYEYIEDELSLKVKKKEINPSDIITEKDLNKVLDKGCFNSRDRAFLAVLHESGCRAGEIINIKVKDITDECTRINVNGKTGKRSIPLKIISPAYLQKWLQDHPCRTHSDFEQEYVWISLDNCRRFQRLNHVGATKIVKRAFGNAKVSKKHNLHWFRHSRATINAQFMTEQMMCIFFGWARGSAQVATYAHTNMQQVDSVMNRHYGLEQENRKDEPLRCHKCTNMNLAGSQFCVKCGTPLTSTAFHQKEKYEDMAFDLLQKIMQDDSLRDKFIKFQGENKTQ